MKIMILDSSLPEWIDTPVHPETGEAWRERYEAILRATIAINNAKLSIDRHRAEKDRKELIEGVRFVKQPYFAEYVDPETGETPKHPTYTMHPDTWATIPADARATFTIKDGDEIRRKLPPVKIPPIAGIKQLALPGPEA